MSEVDIDRQDDGSVGWSDDHFRFAFDTGVDWRETLASGLDLASSRLRGRDNTEETPAVTDADAADPPGVTDPGLRAVADPLSGVATPQDDTDPAGPPPVMPQEESLPAALEAPGETAADDGRGGPDTPDGLTGIDGDPDTPEPPVPPPDDPPPPVDEGRGAETPGTPQPTPVSPPPGPDPAEYGRTDSLPPDPSPTPLSSYTSGPQSEFAYNIQIDFEGTWTVALQAAFIEAADWLSEVILADLPDVEWQGNPIDDIEISATLQPIDGVGGILGGAGPTVVRIAGNLPALGDMIFDSADADSLLDSGDWSAVVLHEMFHALGFGTSWEDMGLTTGSVLGGNLRFTGINATDTYQSEFPGFAAADPFPASGVPVETDGGPGTAGGHWDEAIFLAELMTGWINDGAYVSLMTIAALEDMGYDTVFDDPYDPGDLFGPVPADPLMIA